MIIQKDDPARAPIAKLLQEHLKEMARHSPPESVHAYDVDELRAAGVTFWAAWETDTLLGCGALQALDVYHGEIKSMRTARAHRRKGIADRILKHIIGEAERRGYTRLSLETGSMDAFAPARTLYERAGFSYCGPFADYAEDRNSVFMTLEIDAIR